ncbi:MULTISPECIES: hypothetical protein [unclassified Streptomyces]|uniref:hypothetical protein n=1 Tax=unclassified Streptomyces TaxID=2593676 RepID=UPI0013E296F9|nr:MULTISPECIES: hypothetical protein [unclassified Streptomyces]UQA37637.1 hypothetical protein KRR37_30900 [Streptomyces sp. HNA39]
MTASAPAGVVVRAVEVARARVRPSVRGAVEAEVAAPVPGAVEGTVAVVAEAVPERVVAPGREAAEVAVRVSETAGVAAEEGVAGAPAW